MVNPILCDEHIESCQRKAVAQIKYEEQNNDEAISDYQLEWIEEILKSTIEKIERCEKVLTKCWDLV